MVGPVQVGHPSAWRGTDLDSLSSVAFRLEPRHLAPLEDAYERCVAAGVTTDTLTRADFPLPGIEDELAELLHEVQYGRGFVVLEHLPVGEWPIEKVALTYLGLMSHFGAPEMQSVLGDRVGRVENVSGKDTRERGYRNSAELNLHSDFSHGFLAMLSVRTAATGGESVYASAVTIHNIISEERPDLLEPLYAGFRFHRLDSALPDEAPVTEERIPTFSVVDGLLTCRYARAIIESAMDEVGEVHDPRTREALDYFDAVASRPGVAFEAVVQPGQILLANDLVTLHSRRGFDDAPGEGNGRLFLRAWLRPDEPRPRLPVTDAVPSFERREGASTYYRGRSAKIGGTGVEAS
ncbi:MAG TPA: TauD/TfdA family dioxygenase [Iamia sp.]|nr:TauD/TfdA family dioxygenase [Iamia sp.]